MARFHLECVGLKFFFGSGLQDFWFLNLVSRSYGSGLRVKG